MSNEPAAFSAVYADLKVIKTRDSVQVCFELPREAAGHALNVLGGMPNFGSPTWFAIARLKEPEK